MRLSEREQAVLRLAAEGRPDKEIAGQLGISEETVNWHLRVLFHRFHMQTRTALVAKCLRLGLLR